MAFVLLLNLIELNGIQSRQLVVLAKDSIGPEVDQDGWAGRRRNFILILKALDGAAFFHFLAVVDLNDVFLLFDQLGPLSGGETSR